MSVNAVMFGWNRSLPGRENLSAAHFQDFSAYLQKQIASGAIESFEPVLIEPHGGAFNGFFLIKGTTQQLGNLTSSPEWAQHQVRAELHLEGAAIWRAISGKAVAERMGMWVQAIPK